MATADTAIGTSDGKYFADEFMYIMDQLGIKPTAKLEEAATATIKESKPSGEMKLGKLPIKEYDQTLIEKGPKPAGEGDRIKDIKTRRDNPIRLLIDDLMKK